MADNFKTISDLDISFKEFMPGQVIQSAQFNDDMRDIEEKVNEVIGQHNGVASTVVDHLNNKNNPHEITAHQVGTYTTTEVDEFIKDIKHGHLYDRSITNSVLADWSVDNRTIKDRTITASKVDDVFGSQIDISENIEITGRYTKNEVDELVRSKVGEGAYTKEEIDQKFEEFQSGQIIDKTISADKVTSDFGDKVNISNNISILNRYTKDEVDMLISMNGLPRDWGDLSNESITLEICNIQNMVVGVGKEFYITYITNMPIAEHHVSWDGGSTFYDKTADVVVNNGINMFRHDNNTSVGTYKMVIKVIGTDGQTVTSNVFDVKVVSDTLAIGSLPVAGHMVAGQFTTPSTPILEVNVKENVEARGEYNSVGERLDGVDSQIKNIEDEIKNIGNITAGLTNTAKTLLISILRNAMFNSDQSENITLLADELGVGDSGNLLDSTGAYLLDDFTGTSLDRSKWDYEWGYVRNGELQNYQDTNAVVNNGILELKGIKDSNGTWTSASIISKGHFAFMYGKIECRAKIDPTLGSFGAFWTLGDSFEYRYNNWSSPDVLGEWWAYCGEFDIMEFYNGNFTCGTFFNEREESGRVYYNDYDFNDWHTFAMEWLEDGTLIFSIDGNEISRTSATDNRAFHIPHFILINQAIGASGGTPADSTTAITQYIDWVKYYPANTSNLVLNSSDFSLEVTDTNDSAHNCMVRPIFHDNCINKSLTWSSSDSSLVWVHSGLCGTYAGANGTVTITATSHSGVSKSITLTVTDGTLRTNNYS